MTTSRAQAIWFAKDKWTSRRSKEWCEEHGFVTDDPQHEKDHWIWRQFDPSETDQYRVVADDYPDGVSVTIGLFEEEKMKDKFKSGEQSEDNVFTFVLSTEDPDRDGDIVRQAGIALANFRKNPIALFGHNHSQPVGVWKNVRLEGKKLLADLKLAEEGTSEFIDTLHKLIKQRILKAVSIGFSIKEYDILRDKNESFTGLDIHKSELFEASLVSVPANQNALRVKAKQIIPKELQDIFLSDEKGSLTRAQTSEDSRQKTAKTLQATGGQTPTSETRTKPMNIAERIKQKETRLVSVKDRITVLKGLLEADEEYELSSEEQDEIDALNDEQESLIKSIDSLKKMEQTLASKAAPVSGSARPTGHTTPARAEKKERGGALLTKTIAASVIAKMTDRTTSEVIQEMYGSDDRVKEVSKIYIGRQKTAVALGDTTTTGWAAELVQDDLRGFMEELQPFSVYAQLAALGTSLDFGGNNSVTIPRRDRSNQNSGNATGAAAAAHLGSEIGGSWVGEGGVIPVKKLALTSQTLSRYKLAVISAFTNELLEQSTPSIEGIVRNAILEDTAMVVDGGLLDGVAAVAGVRPSSIVAGVTGTASSGADAASVIADLKVLFAAMSSINGAKPVLIMNSNRLLGLSTVTTVAGGFMFRDEIASGRLLGVPFIASTNVNPSVVVIVDASSFYGANDVPQFTVSDQATLTMANADGTAPTQADDGAGDIGNQEQVPVDGGINVAGTFGGAVGGGAAAAGYTAMSLYQQYSTATRMVLPASWGLARSGAVDMITGVNW